jgi:hypothetical protein
VSWPGTSPADQPDVLARLGQEQGGGHAGSPGAYDDLQ